MHKKDLGGFTFLGNTLLSMIAIHVMLVFILLVIGLGIYGVSGYILFINLPHMDPPSHPFVLVLLGEILAFIMSLLHASLENYYDD